MTRPAFLTLAHEQGAVTRRQALEVFRERKWCEKHRVKNIRVGDVAVALGMMSPEAAQHVAQLQAQYQGDELEDVCKSPMFGERSRRRSMALWTVLLAGGLAAHFIASVDISLVAFIAGMVGAIVELLWRGESTTWLNWRRLVLAAVGISWFTCLVYSLYVAYLLASPETESSRQVLSSLQLRLELGIGVAILLGIVLGASSAWRQHERICSRARMIMFRDLALTGRDGILLTSQSNRLSLLRRVGEIVHRSPYTRAMTILLPWWRRRTRIVVVSYMEPIDGTQVGSQLGRFRLVDCVVIGAPEKMKESLNLAIEQLKANYQPAGFDPDWFDEAFDRARGHGDGRRAIEAFRSEPDRRNKISLAGSTMWANRMFTMTHPAKCRSWDNEHLQAIQETSLRESVRPWLGFCSCVSYPVPLPDRQASGRAEGVVMVLRNIQDGFTLDDKTLVASALRFIVPRDSPPGSSPTSEQSVSTPH